MKRRDLIDLLCGEDGEPYPLDALYHLEGLSYPELQTLLRRHRRGDPPASITRGGARREIAESLGADDDQARQMAHLAGPSLEHVSRTAARVGLDLRGLAVRLDALEARVKALEAARPVARVGRLLALTEEEEAAW